MNVKIWDDDFIGSDFMGKTINFTVDHLLRMSASNYTYGPALYYDGRDGVHSRQRVGTAFLTGCADTQGWTATSNGQSYSCEDLVK